MLSRLLVLNQHFPLLTVPPRLLFRDTYDVEDGRRLAEDGVHLLEGTVGRLGVEEVDDGEEEGVAVMRLGLFAWERRKTLVGL